MIRVSCISIFFSSLVLIDRIVSNSQIYQSLKQSLVLALENSLSHEPKLKPNNISRVTESCLFIGQIKVHRETLDTRQQFPKRDTLKCFNLRKSPRNLIKNAQRVSSCQQNLTPISESTRGFFLLGVKR